MSGKSTKNTTNFLINLIYFTKFMDKYKNWGKIKIIIPKTVKIVQNITFLSFNPV